MQREGMRAKLEPDKLPGAKIKLLPRRLKRQQPAARPQRAHLGHAPRAAALHQRMQNIGARQCGGGQRRQHKPGSAQ